MKLRILARAAALLATVALATIPVNTALASPIPYVTAPLDTINASVNQGILNANVAMAPAAILVACTGTTAATCQGLRMAVSITGLTTAASTLSAAVTVTDTLVTATSQVFCATNIYAGTGIPIPVNVIPAAGSFAFAIQNVSTAAALNATVPIECMVYN